MVGYNKKWRGHIFEGGGCKFEVGDNIDNGGSSCVCEVLNLKIDGQPKDGEFVVKIFNPTFDRTKRYKRFKNEISEITRLLTEKKDMKIMPIIGFNVDREEKAWYLMPRGIPLSKYLKNTKVSFIEKIKIMLELANILFELHNLGCSHRDIKLDNILIFNKEVYLIDFGLICIVGERVTGNHEKMGPHYWGPPELQNDILAVENFAPSDVYLFAKTVWMCLKKEGYGFRGTYHRTGDFYLRREDFNVFTLEPIHEMLEESTKEKMEERIDIHKCIEYLKYQLEIARNGENAENSYAYRDKESTLEILNKNKESERIFREINTIFFIVEEKIQSTTIYIDREGLRDELNINRVEKHDNLIVLIDKQKNNHYLCCPDYVIIKNQKLVKLHTKAISDLTEYGEFTEYGEKGKGEWIADTGQKILLNQNMNLKFKTKT